MEPTTQPETVCDHHFVWESVSGYDSVDEGTPNARLYKTRNGLEWLVFKDCGFAQCSKCHVINDEITKEQCR